MRNDDMFVRFAITFLDGFDNLENRAVAIGAALHDVNRGFAETILGNSILRVLDPIAVRANEDSIEFTAQQEFLKRMNENGLLIERKILFGHALDIHSRTNAASKNSSENH